MVLIDGKKLAEKINAETKQEIRVLKETENIFPGLAVIVVGEDPASKIYINNKKKKCEELGIYSEVISFPKDVSQIELLETIGELNEEPKISGILVQLPLPEHINQLEVLSAIKPKKDVDGFHPISVGKLSIGKPELIPCTPQGIIELIKETGTDLTGKECVVIGRSNIVGKPAALLLLQQNATVTICHSKTKGIESIIKRADIVVIAIGKPNFLKGYMLKQGAIVIDVGTNRTEDGKLVGDADAESIAKVAGFATPVPGGVGPMTIAMLMQNTAKAAKLNNNPYINKSNNPNPKKDNEKKINQ